MQGTRVLHFPETQSQPRVAHVSHCQGHVLSLALTPYHHLPEPTLSCPALPCHAFLGHLPTPRLIFSARYSGIKKRWTSKYFTLQSEIQLLLGNMPPTRRKPH